MKICNPFFSWSRMQNSYKGFFLVLFVFLLFAMIMLVALAIDLGFVATGSSRLQNVANLATFSAIERFIEYPNLVANFDPMDSVQVAQREQAALDRANAILAQNKIKGMSADLGGLDTIPGGGPGGALQFGAWFPEDPGPGDPCSGASNYPCFLPSYAPLTNAIRISLRNQAPISSFFSKIIGTEGFSISANATATIISKCTAYLLDVSLSTTEDSHPLELPPRSYYWFNLETGGATSVLAPCSGDYPSPLNRPPSKVICPINGALFAMTAFNLRHFGGSGPGYLSPTSPVYHDALCRIDNFTSLDIFDTDEGVVWCNIMDRNQARRDRYNTGLGDLIFDETQHFPRDYNDMPSPYGAVRVDRYVNPEPLSTFLGAFNSGIRTVKEQISTSDRAVIIAFGGNERGIRATADTPGELDFLIQLTNVNNRGVLPKTAAGYGADQYTLPSVDPNFPEIHPNFIDRGWFPLLTNDLNASETHIAFALQQAMVVLQDPNFCPTTARKSIILATDGVPSCAEGWDPDCPGGRNYAVYQMARSELINPSDPNDSSTITYQLKQNRIALTVLLSGATVQPNFLNIPNGSEGFLSFDEARALGWGWNSTQSFFDTTPQGAADDQEAYENRGPGVLFREPNGVFGQMVFETGGVLCPLMQPCTPTSPDINQAECTATNPSGCATPCISDNYPPGCSSNISPGQTRCCSNGCYTQNSEQSHLACRLKNEVRLPNSRQTCAVEDLSRAEQAALCARQATGANPYILVGGDLGS